MKIPINTNQFEDFIVKNKLFGKTRESMVQYLKNWYEDDKEHFLEDMWENFDTVMNTYNFENDGVSFSKSYSYESPLDYISVWIKIYDNEGDYCVKYTAFYDYDLNCFDDTMSG